MTQSFEINNLNTGSVPNDGTGDSLRDAMKKVQGNFETLFTYGNSRHRQSILESEKTQNGKMNFLVASGLNIRTTGSLVCSLMVGKSSRGEMNIFYNMKEEISASLFPNKTNILMLTYVSESGNFSLDVSTGSYTDGYSTPTSPLINDIFVDRKNYAVLKYNGAEWIPTPSILLANILTGGSTVLSMKYNSDNEDLVAARKEAIKYSLIF